MNTLIVILLLVGFSLCVTVGLISVLQNLVSGDYGDESGSLQHPGPIFRDRAERHGS